MIILKDTIQKKLKKENKQCFICKNYFTSDDLYFYNFEYIKNEHGEKYCHNTCIERS